LALIAVIVELLRHRPSAESGADNFVSELRRQRFSDAMKAIRKFDQQRRRKLTALFGILIFALFAATQATHFHPADSQADNSHCSVCLAAHAPVTVLALPKLPVLAATLEPIVRAETESCHSAPLPSPLFSRPPPSVSS
jgi:hypothetical protein